MSVISMWIRNTNPATGRLYDEWMEESVDDTVEDLPGEKQGVEFDGPIQVKKEVGEQLVKQYDAIEEHETDEEQ